MNALRSSLRFQLFLSLVSRNKKKKQRKTKLRKRIYTNNFNDNLNNKRSFYYMEPTARWSFFLVDFRKNEFLFFNERWKMCKRTFFFATTRHASFSISTLKGNLSTYKSIWSRRSLAFSPPWRRSLFSPKSKSHFLPPLYLCFFAPQKWREENKTFQQNSVHGCLNSKVENLFKLSLMFFAWILRFFLAGFCFESQNSISF